MKRRGFIGSLLAMVGLAAVPEVVASDEPKLEFDTIKMFAERVGPGVRIFPYPPQHFITTDGKEFLRSAALDVDGEHVWFQRIESGWVKV